MYVPLHVHSPFSFLDGAASLRDLMERAAHCNCPAIALTDHNNLCGAVAFRREAERWGLKPLLGCEIDLEGGHHLVLLAMDEEGYANLCRLLTRAHLDSPRRQPRLRPEHLQGATEGLLALSGCRKGEIPSRILSGDLRGALEAARRYQSAFPGRFYLELEGCYLPGTRRLNDALWELAKFLRLPAVMTTNVHYAFPSQFPVHDILTCVRTLSRVDDVHPERKINAENYLKSPREMAELAREYPGVLQRTVEVAQRCQPLPVLGRLLTPHFPLPEGMGAEQMLRQLVYAGAREKYGRVTEKVRRRLERELEIICRLGYQEYFLVVWDLVRFARRKGIRHAGRGSAADSLVAYCLGITEVDALARGLLFERFLSLERAQKPDIDVDFDARYRDEVIRYAREKYGADRVAGVCTYNTFRARSAIRDLGKALGFPPQEIDRLAKRFSYVEADMIEEAVRRLPELRNGGLPLERYELLFELCSQVAGFPRHLGTHLGGIVIGPEPLEGVVPLQMAAKGITVCQFDKDYVEEVGLIKLDLLSLRTLSAVEDAVVAIRERHPQFDYQQIPLDDRETFRMINRGETVGVFQLESPAQRALQVRLGASDLEDIVASVALIRPGPIKGNMVEPFLARRHGRQEPRYLLPELEPILRKTYGVVLFQEQVIEIATTVAGFTPGEADRLRRAMTHHRSPEEMEELGRLFVEKARRRGVPEETAAAVFSHIKGYASYGFCEAHAAAFATTAFKTAYLLRHYPAEFFAALLSNQPMGYYPPRTLCVEAKRRGVRVLGPCVNRSGSRCQVEGRSVRLSLGYVRGVGPRTVQRILSCRPEGGFSSLEEFWRLTGVDGEAVPNLILCGAFDALDPHRRRLLRRWSILRSGGGREGEPWWREEVDGFRGPDFTPWEKICWEQEIVGIPLTDHFMACLRPRLACEGAVTAAEVQRCQPGQRVRVAGLPVRPHRPPTRSGRTVAFFTLEDETGLLEVTVFERNYHRYGHLLFGPQLLPLMVVGRVKKQGSRNFLVAEHLYALVPSGRRKSSC